MSPIRCPDCERNVSLEISEAEVQETRFDDSENKIEVDIHMTFVCAECGGDLGEYTGMSDHEVPKLAEYLEKHDYVDASEAEVEDADVDTKIITRNGRKTYLAKWSTQVKLNRKVFNVAGDLGITQDEIDLFG